MRRGKKSNVYSRIKRTIVGLDPELVCATQIKVTFKYVELLCNNYCGTYIMYIQKNRLGVLMTSNDRRAVNKIRDR